MAGFDLMQLLSQFQGIASDPTALEQLARASAPPPAQGLQPPQGAGGLPGIDQTFPLPPSIAQPGQAPTTQTPSLFPNVDINQVLPQPQPGDITAGIVEDDKRKQLLEALAGLPPGAQPKAPPTLSPRSVNVGGAQLAQPIQPFGQRQVPNIPSLGQLLLGG